MDEIADKAETEKQVRAPQLMTNAKGLPLTESQLPLDSDLTRFH